MSSGCVILPEIWTAFWAIIYISLGYYKNQEYIISSFICIKCKESLINCLKTGRRVKGGKVLELAAQRGSAWAIPRDIKHQTGRDSEQPDVAVYVLFHFRGVGTEDLFQLRQFSNIVSY